MKNSSKRPSNLSKLLALNWRQTVLLCKALGILTVYKGLLLVLPFHYFLKKANRIHVESVTPEDDSIESAVWAIRVVSNRIPLGFTCLVQALSAKWLLRKYAGVRIHIGVHKSTTQEFSAHAWVAYNDTVILGEQTTQVFQPILEWN